MASLGQLSNDEVIKNYKLGKYNTVSPVSSDTSSTTIHPLLANYGKQTTQPSFLSDIGTSVAAGGLDTGAGLTTVGNKLGVIPNEASKNIVNNLTNKATELRQTRSKSFNEGISQPFVDNNNNVNVKAFNAPKILGGLAESAPAIAGTILGSAALETAAAPIAGAIGLGKVGSAIAETFPSIARLAETTPGVGTAAQKVNKFLGSSISTGTSEGVIAAGQNSNSVYKQAVDAPIDTYRTNPLFHEIVSSLDPSIPLDQREQQAKEILAQKAADDTFKDTFGSTAGIGILTGGGAVGSLKRAFSNGTGPLTSNIIKSLGKGAVEEMFQEIPQSAAEQYLSNKAIKTYVDPSKNTSEGVLNAAAEGAVLGGVSGGAFGGISHFAPSVTQQEDVSKNKVNPLTGVDYQNKDINNIANHYTQTAITVPDATHDTYKGAYTNSVNSLDKIIKEETSLNNSNPNPIKLQEAKDTLEYISKSHDALISSHITEDSSKAQAQAVGEQVAKGETTNTPEVKIPEDIAQEVDTKVNSLVDNGIPKEAAIKQVTPEIQQAKQETQQSSNEFDKVVNDAIDNKDISSKDIADRRANNALRQNYIDLQSRRRANEVSQLKSKVTSLTNELNTNPISGILNKRAFIEQVDASSHPAVASIDIDSLKAVNDNLGHEAGDKLLKTVAKVLSKHVDAFHVSGDELVAKGTSEEELKAGLEKAQKELLSGKHSINDDNGTFTTPSFSYGISKVTPEDFSSSTDTAQVVSKSLKRADLNMLAHKTTREASGERAARGEIPKGLTLTAQTKLSPKEQDIKSTLNSEADSTNSTLALDNLDQVDNASDAEALYKEAEKSIPTLTPEQRSEIANIESEIDYQKQLRDSQDISYDPSRLKELNSKLKELRPAKPIVNRTISKEDSLFKDTETYLEDDGGLTELSFDTENSIPFTKVDHASLRSTLNKLLGNIKKTELSKENLTITYVEDFNNFDWAKEGITKSQALSRARGLYNISKSDFVTRVYLNGSVLGTKERLVGTFAHEVIGHYGIDKVLGEDHRRLMIKMLNNDDGGKLRSDILSLLPRWKSYLNNWNRLNPGLIDQLDYDKVVIFLDPISKIKEKIPLEIAVKLADEYMAELAKTKFMERGFLEKEVGLGMSTSTTRSSLRNRRERWLTLFINKLRHMFKSIFGNSMDFLSNNDLEKIVAESVDNLFEVVDTDHITPSNSIASGVYSTPTDPYMGFGELTLSEVSLDTDPTQLHPDQITNEFTAAPIEDLNAFVTGAESSLGNHADNVRNKFWKGLNDIIAQNPLLSMMGTFGNMQHQDAYKAIENVFLGKITKLEGHTKAFAGVISSLNPIQRQAAFIYSTTKGADINNVPITPIQKNVLVKSKEAIRELGKALAEAGIINKDTYEKNEDAYLHTMYLKYIDQYRGSNKRTSLMSWASSKKDLDERERLALGQIKDVRFLVPETLGILARDHTLLNMFNTINKASTDNKLFWVITSEDKITYLGKKVTIDQAQDQLDRNKFILSEYEKGNADVFFTKENDEYDPVNLYNQLKVDTEHLALDITNVENKIIEEARSHAEKTGQHVGDAKSFLEDKYVKLDNTKHLGALRNKWVRKEIASDLGALTSAYSLKDKDGLEKFLAPHGTLDRMHRFWKMSMVGLNPGSWVRNGLGNFALLDLSTSTSKVKLIKMLHSELSDTLKGNKSDWWKLSEQYGLFGSTFSAVELQEIHNEYADDLKRAKDAYEARTDTAIDKQLHFLDERLLSVIRVMQNKTSKNYALLEGLFKTVALRDYVEIWENQNKDKYPNGIQDLTDQEKQIVYSKAAKHANDSLFDYSQVNSFIKTLRRVPFGSPFITFSYKAIPASVRAMINQPIKFAQYATLPVLMTMLAQAYQDWDDDDIAKLRRQLPDYYRLNPGVGFFPFKDSLGRPQILSLEYIQPWSQLAIASRKVVDNYYKDGGESPISTTAKSIGTVFNEFGFLGGPTPSAIAAMLSGKDDFTGKDIITPGASASQQLGEIMKFAYNLSVPAWVGSNGWFSKMYQAFGRPDTNAFGDVKYTPGQAISDITGFRPVAVNQSGIKARKLGFDARLKEVATLRTKIIKDRNSNYIDKANDLKDIATREKLIRSQMREQLFSS